MNSSNLKTGNPKKQITFITLKTTETNSHVLSTVKEQIRLALPVGQKAVITTGDFDVFVETVNMKNGKKLFIVNLNSEYISADTITDVKQQLKAVLPKGYKSMVLGGATTYVQTVSI
jgi:GH25 family lysozyme M1 (1,4-beta-N-acetylmuramidase)